MLPNIVKELMNEDLIKLFHMLISNADFVASNLGLGSYIHLTFTMDIEDYFTQTGQAFVSPPQFGRLPSHPRNITISRSCNRAVQI